MVDDSKIKKWLWAKMKSKGAIRKTWSKDEVKNVIN